MRQMSSWLMGLHLVLDRDKGKVKPGEFPNLATPEATSVDHSDQDLIFIWSKVLEIVAAIHLA